MNNRNADTVERKPLLMLYAGVTFTVAALIGLNVLNSTSEAASRPLSEGYAVAWDAGR
jgi:hypothetical protein